MNIPLDNDETCIICFHQLPKKKKYIICYTCNKKYHYNCVMEWYKQNKYNERVCPHCMTNDFLYVFDDKWYYDYCSCFGYAKYKPVINIK